MQRIYPDVQHWNFALPKLKKFWRICTLPEILGRWYTQRCTVPLTLPSKDAICFCWTETQEDSILRSNNDCPFKGFTLLVSLSPPMTMAKTWYCPHCCRLPQFKRKRNTRKSPQPTVVSDHAAMKCDSICISKAKPTPTDKSVQWHGESRKNGKYFHLACLEVNAQQSQKQPGNAVHARRFPLHKLTTPPPFVLCQILPVVRMKVMLLWMSPRVRLIRLVHWQT